MAKVKLHPLLKQFRGMLKGIVFRLSHNGEISAYAKPDMSGIKWSAAQVAHRERMAESSAYARAAIADPQIRLVYEQISLEKKGNKRPYDMAVSDYYNGNNLLGDKFRWDVESWRATQRYRKHKRR